MKLTNPKIESKLLTVSGAFEVKTIYFLFSLFFLYVVLKYISGGQQSDGLSFAYLSILIDLKRYLDLYQHTVVTILSLFCSIYDIQEIKKAAK